MFSVIEMAPEVMFHLDYRCCNIVVAGFAALVQTDIKRILGLLNDESAGLYVYGCGC
jgi:NADH:ubiquinone oxidoreductase subunit 5 (subunit L)/multisubunit Na+/H+ antiporter MnhA subunit